MSDVESLLGDTLRECPPLTEFADKGQLARGGAHAQLKIRDGEHAFIVRVIGDVDEWLEWAGDDT